MAETETEQERVSRSQMYKHEDVVGWLTDEGFITPQSTQAEVIAAFAAQRNAYRRTERYATLVATHAEEGKAAKAEATAAREAAKAERAEARAAAKAEKEAAKAAAEAEKAAAAEAAPAEKPAKATRASKRAAAKAADAGEGDENPFD